MGVFDYSDEFMFGSDVATSAIGIFMAIYLLFFVIATAFSLLSYVLQSLGMYTIAQRRGIRYAWLAWVPVGNLWILGSISDQYQYVAKGKVKNRRKVLLGLFVSVIVLYFAMMISMVAGMIAADAVPVLFGTLGGMLLLCAVAVATAVVQYMALYDLFQSCQPSNATLYLVLSILISVTLPFLVFACRKKDLGMPPKKQKPVEVISQPLVEEIAEDPAEIIVEESAEGYAQPEEFEE